MNILIPHTWLLEHLETEAEPTIIQKYLSLCGPSVERIYEREAAVSEEETEKVEEAVEQAGETAETVETETAEEAAKEVEAIESGNEDMNE